jgi:hypothetical protein
MTYHRQFEISQPCTPGLCGELCSWINRWMVHDSPNAARFVLSTDCSFYVMYDITNSNFVCLFHHYYSFCFLTYQ